MDGTKGGPVSWIVSIGCRTKSASGSGSFANLVFSFRRLVQSKNLLNLRGFAASTAFEVAVCRFSALFCRHETY